MKHKQFVLFEPQAPEPAPMPAGFRYAPDLIDAAGEARLGAGFRRMTVKRLLTMIAPPM